MLDAMLELVWWSHLKDWNATVEVKCGQEGIPVRVKSAGAPAGNRMRFLSRS